MLKGTTKIELTNVKTGETEVIEKENMVTNAVRDILQLNPNGIRFRSYYTKFRPANDASPADLDFQKQFFPLCPNLFGGVLLYENALEEDPDRYYADMENPMVGYSSCQVNSGNDTMRGSMNLTESDPLEDGSGYKFVFDFATSQANGTISALGLTSKMGGVAGYGSRYDYYGNRAFGVDVYESATTGDRDYLLARYSVVSIDAGKNEAIFAYVDAKNTIKVGRLTLPLSAVGLRSTIAPYPFSLIESKTLTTSKFAATVAQYYFYGTLIDGGDGYIWGFQLKDNAAGNNTEQASVLWIKISKTDFSFTEGEFTVAAKLWSFGVYTITPSKPNNKMHNYSIIKDGYLYIPKYSADPNYTYGVYKINLSNPTDTELLENSDGIYIGISDRNGYTYPYYSTLVNEINGVIVYPGGHINGGKLMRDYATTFSYDNHALGLHYCSKPSTKYGPFLVCCGGYYYGTGSYNYYLSTDTILQSAYLATINNLPSPVQKTADKTMKITYILREEME